MGPTVLKTVSSGNEQGFLPYGKQEITEDDVRAVVAILHSNYLTQGPAVEQFEKNLEQITGAKNAVAVSNGTAALHLAYLALGVTSGDAVFIPAVTFAATANAVRYCGATPVFVDVDKNTGLLLLSSLEEAVALAKLSGLKPRAVTLVHMAGRPALTQELKNFCELNHLFLIEDACHALGAEFRFAAGASFQKVGSGIESDATVLSFHPVKHITTGEGGAVLTPSYELAKKIVVLRSHVIIKYDKDLIDPTLAFNTNGEINPWYQEMQVLGYNYRMCDISAALGISQLKRLDTFVDKRRLLADFYRENLTGLPFSVCPSKDTKLTRHSYHLFSLQVDFNSLLKSRSSVMNELKTLGIGTQVHYLPVPWHPYYRNSSTNSLSVSLPGAETYYERTLSIPMYPALFNNGKERIVQALWKVFKR